MLPGTSRKPAWQSFSPETSCCIQAELELAKFLHAHAVMDKLPNCWRSDFLQLGLLVQHASVEGTWFSMGSIGGSCTCLWPAERFQVSTMELYGLKRIASSAELCWVPVLQFEDWH
eukprot:8324861-Alexandrium_andersonii.AAC.1